MRRAHPLTPDALRLREALDGSAPLARLREMLARTNARFEALRSALPADLLEHVRAVPSDDGALGLIADNSAVAAKLRQWVPRLEQQLLEHGHHDTAVRIRIRTR